MLRVTKRDGTLEEVDFNKITDRIKFLCQGTLKDGSVIGKPLESASQPGWYATIAINVIKSIVDKIQTRELDEHAAKICANRVDEHYEYGTLGGRIAISNHQKNTLGSFADTMKLLYENTDNLGNPRPILNRNFYKTVMRNREVLEDMIDYRRDYRIDLFGFKTMEKSYFLRRDINEHSYVIERPQHVYMRVAVALYRNMLDSHYQRSTGLSLIQQTYDALSLGFMSCASPTMYNAGTISEQLSSCFLLGINDSMDDDGGIPDCWKSCARISKRAGGIGVGITPIRGSGSHIYGVNGPSDGIVPMVRVFNDIARYVNQGGRRKGAFAMYLEPWHPDIIDFLDLKKVHGKEELRARDLFYAMWMPDIFMDRVIEAIENDRPVKWTLMCPNSSHKEGYPRLYDTYGDEFTRIYEEYEADGLGIKTFPDIRVVWSAILKSQKETGTPYMLYKDSVNRKNNQSNLGTIRNSNLCAEILEYSNAEEHAVCNLASMVLSAYVVTDDTGHKKVDFEKIVEMAKLAHKNLDRVIDINFYPTIETRRSNMRHRPVGLGQQAIADLFMELDLDFDSPEAVKLNRQVSEAIYYGTQYASMELARDREETVSFLKIKYDEGKLLFEDNGFDNNLSELADTEGFEGIDRDFHVIREELEREQYLGSYSSYEGSEMSKGKFQFDLWNEKPDPELGLDWDHLRAEIAKYGIRNSLTTALMPTASTAHILGNTECIEPVKYNLYTRRVLSGEFILINKYMQAKLIKHGLWSDSIRKQLIANRGSIQDIKEIPLEIRKLYRTAFELKMKTILQMSRDRAPFIDQTQSLNIYCKNPTDSLLTSIHFHGYKLGLKTGSYYIRRETTATAIQFTVDEPDEEEKKTPIREPSGSPDSDINTDIVKDDNEECLNCGT